MDAVQAYVNEKSNEAIERFLVTGASKRGWTTYLTAAVDSRVKAMAPIVIDMLNMKAHTQWAEKMFGKQSEQIHDYTDLNLIDKMDEPGMIQLRQWVDPYHYRDRYTMPKLLLLGTNDPYWVVDSTRHYYSELPDPKLIYQTPNAGHGLNGGDEALRTLAAFYEMIADDRPVPRVDGLRGEAPHLAQGAEVGGHVALGGIHDAGAAPEDRVAREERPLLLQEVRAQSSHEIGGPEVDGSRARPLEYLLEPPYAGCFPRDRGAEGAHESHARRLGQPRSRRCSPDGVEQPARTA
jgi:hypothetical protein